MACKQALELLKRKGNRTVKEYIDHLRGDSEQSGEAGDSGGVGGHPGVGEPEVAVGEEVVEGASSATPGEPESRTKSQEDLRLALVRDTFPDDILLFYPFSDDLQTGPGAAQTEGQPHGQGIC